jgi:HEAT repeat protein
MHPLLAKLSGGDFRSIGRSEQVAADVLANPALFPILMEGISSNEALIRLRAADTAEKVTRRHPEWLKPYKRKLLDEISAIDQQEVRWHIALMFPRIEWTAMERKRVTSILKSWLDNKSRIVQVFSLQALADLSRQEDNLKAEVIALIRQKMNDGSPSIQSRGRKLLRQLST